MVRNFGAFFKKHKTLAFSIVLIVVFANFVLPSVVLAATVITNFTPPTNLQLTGLDSTIRINFTPSTDPQTTWHVASVWDGNILVQSKVFGKTANVGDLNGLTPGKQYTIKLQALNAQNQLSQPITVVGSTDPQSPMRNAAFFDNFNAGPHGPLDPNYFDVRMTTGYINDGGPNPNTADGLLVFNNERHFHTQIIGGGGVGGLSIRPRTQFDFTNRTGTIEFEVDLPPIQKIHGKWFEMTVLKDMLPIDGNLGDGQSGLFPNSVTFTMQQGNKGKIAVNVNGTKTEFNGTIEHFSPSNVRVPIVLKLSKTSAEMFINGNSAVKATGFTLPFEKGWLTLAHRNYFGARGIAYGGNDPVITLQLLHWDVIQFDGPQGSYNPVIQTFVQPNCPSPLTYDTYAGSIRNCGDMKQSNGGKLTFNIKNLQTLRSVRLTTNTDDPNASGNLILNGTSIPIPPKVPVQSFYDDSMYTGELPLNLLLQGQNTLDFSKNNSVMFEAVQVEAVYNEQRILMNDDMPPMKMIGATAGTFFIEKYPTVPSPQTFTTQLYSLGSNDPINYTAKVITSSPWLTITSPTTGTLKSPVFDGTLVPLSLTIDVANAPKDGDGVIGTVKVDGGNMPVYISIMVADYGRSAPVTIRSSFTNNESVYNKAAVPDYHGDPNITSAPTATMIPMTLSPVVTSTSTPRKPGDANGDSNVDGVDYITWLTHYNQPTTHGAVDGDFNGNGVTDGVDYITWLTNYGK